ncbi:dynein light chain Tctex-type 4 [Bombina bombina]|uniref:dynein light chain Tctex-type 4 n=1 Tax=Bombina bombina TaxID=8345 RepID=UPI00235A4C98|nr:dynein light chain Tctex-type 4 [Bombina bombina]
MASYPQSLSEEILEKFNQAISADGPGVSRARAASISTRRSSHSIDMSPRPILRLKSIEERAPNLSRRNSSISNINLPFSRRNSLCAGGPGKRLSLGPWAHYGRVSFSGLPLFQPIREVQYENTYKTCPDEDCRFKLGRVQNILEKTLGSYLGGSTYTPLTSGQLTQNLSEIIRNKLKDHIPPRYKVVCNVILGEKGNQGVKISSRSLWDSQNDNYASATYTNTSLFAVAMVHGMYYE